MEGKNKGCYVDTGREAARKTVGKTANRLEVSIELGRY